MKFFAATLAAMASAQQIGTNTQEQHLNMKFQECESGSCFDNYGSIVLDANWRSLHNVGGYTNCYTGNSWDTSICPDNKTCAEQCAIDGVDNQTWANTYGVTSSGTDLKLGFVTQGAYAKNVGSRTYLMDSAGHYKQFQMANKEFSFTVDVSNLPCGVNGALYFAEMPADGGKGEYGDDKAGADYGVGYCDAQCPHDVKFINGEANAEGWNPSPADPNAGSGKYGSCCMEFDIWEANSISQAFTAHPCTVDRERCSGGDCGDNETNDRYGGICDKDGCDFATFRHGAKNFYGPGSQFDVDTTQKFQVITQFLTADGTDNGEITEIRRKYVQNGKTIETPSVTINGKEHKGISDDFCEDVKGWFGDQNDFKKKGGLSAMSRALTQGMTLVLSIWDDHAVNMLWLDSDYPTDRDPSEPGVARGTCSTDSGKPEDVESQHPDAHVIFGDIRYGAIDSTYGEGYNYTAFSAEFTQ